MTKLVAFEESAVKAIQERARKDSLETCAAGLIAAAGTRDGQPRYTVRELVAVPDSAYLNRTEISASLAPRFCMELANRARAADMGVFLAHTHPGVHPLEGFSAVDDAGEVSLAEYYLRRIPNAAHFSAVFTATSAWCRPLGSQAQARIQIIGRSVSELRHEFAFDSHEVHEKYSRQILAFGETGQKILAGLRIAVVGAGGTGSFVLTELAHLGVKNFLLIDPDLVEDTNLNRLVGAGGTDVGQPKVTVAAQWISQIDPAIICSPEKADIVDDGIARKLLDVDFIFLCTDSHASRAVVNQIAYQYLIPCIDMGVAIHTDKGAVTDIVGRVQMLASGLSCLLCGGRIDPNQVRLEMMTPEMRRADPYFTGEGVKQPSVISLNGSMASLAITMFLSAVTGIPSEARLMHYNAIRGSVKATLLNPQPGCLVCSNDGALGRGNSWTLPTRKNVSH
jgi:molybdopterin/thiamine biosynthesis adenylyltransferase